MNNWSNRKNNSHLLLIIAGVSESEEIKIKDESSSLATHPTERSTAQLLSEVLAGSALLCHSVRNAGGSFSLRALFCCGQHGSKALCVSSAREGPQHELCCSHTAHRAWLETLSKSVSLNSDPFWEFAHHSHTARFFCPSHWPTAQVHSPEWNFCYPGVTLLSLLTSDWCNCISRWRGTAEHSP